MSGWNLESLAEKGERCKIIVSQPKCAKTIGTERFFSLFRSLLENGSRVQRVGTFMSRDRDRVGGDE